MTKLREIVGLRIPMIARSSEHIRLRGVRQNNLKGFDVDIPLGKLTVVTGLSGTGKSSLVFDTLHAEGQRRYVETFSPYARQFLEMLDRPDVDGIENIRPSIAIQQSSSVRTSRSTVGTMTELCDYFKVWFCHVASLYDPETGEKIEDDNPQAIFGKARSAWPGRTVLLAFEVRKPENFEWEEIIRSLTAQGFSRILHAGRVWKSDDLNPAESSEDGFFPIQDRLRLSKDGESRFVDGCRTALQFGQGQVLLFGLRGNLLGQFSEGLNSPSTGRTYRSPTPSMFSFNSPIGACPHCRGFGRIIEIDYGLVMPDHSLSVSDGLIKAFQGTVYSESQRDLVRACKKQGIPTNVPYRELSRDVQAFVLDGDPDYRLKKRSRLHSWYGVRRFFDWLERNTYKMHVRVFLSRYRAYTECPACEGTRLQSEALNWRWRRHTLPKLYRLPISELLTLFEKHHRGTGNHQADMAADSIITRLQYLVQVGLGYLTLDRQSRTLSGGELGRVNLTSCLGTSLVDTLFVLDEPSIGLHSRDVDRLIAILMQLTAQGNTVVVVEHDESIIRAADHIIELGPAPGSEGGQLIFNGNSSRLLGAKDSVTAAYLTDRERLEVPARRRAIRMGARGKGRKQDQLTPGLFIQRAWKHNIRNLSLRIPLGRFVCLSGVSGSGKSTLLDNIIHQGLLSQKGVAVEDPAKISKIAIDLPLSEVALVNQSPLTRTPRSNPALYTDAWNSIRELFAKTKQARASGLGASSFSFNGGDGRCEQCRGLGYERVEMQFVADVFVTCPLCDGRRFKLEVLEISYKERTITDVLGLTASEAATFFDDQPSIRNRLKVLDEVGLGYLTLGQPLNTLSGGESQRLKLVRYVSRMEDPAKPSLLLLDEPTTGLHRHDVKCLIKTLQRLVDLGHSLIVIEHHLDILKSADWIIEMGPEAGNGGGQIIFQGTPEEMKEKWIPTAGFLQRMLEREKETDLRAVPKMRMARPSNGSGSSRAESKPYRQRYAKLERRAAEDPTEDRNSRTGCLEIRGARENNLRNLSISIPHRKVSVVTGISGSGKSSLAFDIIFAEGQRRYMESMSPYARQYVEQLPRPDLDLLTGILPTVAIEQRATQGTRKSTVATITEVAQYFRLLYARIGVQHNPHTGEALVALPASVLFRRLQSILKEDKTARTGPIYLCAPLVRSRKGHHQPLADWAAGQGFKRLRVDGRFVRISKFQKLDRYREHDIELVVEELKRGRTIPPSQLRGKLEEALRLGKGACFLARSTGRITTWLSSKKTDPSTGESYPELDPKNFSWNSPKGWCPTCRGYGRIFDWMSESEDFPAEIRRVKPGSLCPKCEGARLNRIGRTVYLYLKSDRNISLPELLKLPPQDVLECLQELKLDRRGTAIVKEVLPEIIERLNFMDRVGLGYLALDRATSTLSGGEAQRIRLAAQLGSNLSGVLYVLDEPSIGLHSRDNARLLDSLKELRNNGNTLLIVEHDEEAMRSADHVIDLGPGAGRHGGRVMATGSLSAIKRAKSSLTGRYLKRGITHPMRGTFRPLPAPFTVRQKTGMPDWLVARKVAFRNLKGQDLFLPLRRLIMVCGISGAGKSTLVRDLLKPLVAQASHKDLQRLTQKSLPREVVFESDATGKAPFKELLNGHVFRHVIEVDQKPIGKTPRSTPATYIKAFDIIRQFFSSLPDSRIRGYPPSTFSFNTKHGRCETCKGAGRLKLEMSFMPDAYIPCEECRGDRYDRELQGVRWKNKSIADVLNMTFEEAAGFFGFHSRLKGMLDLMVETGLGYLTLGQSSPTLSGGEAQRLKLVSELAKGLQTYADKMRGVAPRNLYILEEPTIGLHFSDCERLIELLHRIVDQGHTVIVIEHNLDLIAEADYVVEIGPEGGEAGGEILYQGPVQGLLDCKRSPTAPFLKGKLSTKPPKSST